MCLHHPLWQTSSKTQTAFSGFLPSITRPNVPQIVSAHISQNRCPMTMVAAPPSRRSAMSKLAISLSVALTLASTSSLAADMTSATTSPSNEVMITRSPMSNLAEATDHPAFSTITELVTTDKDDSPLIMEMSTSTGEGLESTSLEESKPAVRSEHVPLGEKITDFLQKNGVPNTAIVFILSAMPVVELRAGIPAGFLLGLPAWQTFTLGVAGNIAPILPTLLLMRLPFVQRLSRPILNRASRLATGVGSASSRVAGLALFVGVPLPGTGAWTGTIIAFVLGVPLATAFGALSAGVVMAGVIMTALCALGWIGAAVASAVLGSMGIAAVARSLKKSSDDTPS